MPVCPCLYRRQVSLPPYGSVELTVEYSPSTLDHEEEATIAVEGDAFGRIEYQVSHT